MRKLKHRKLFTLYFCDDSKPQVFPLHNMVIVINTHANGWKFFFSQCQAFMKESINYYFSIPNAI